MTAPLVTRIALDPEAQPRPGSDHGWRVAVRPDLYSKPHEVEPSPALVALGFRERTEADMQRWWRR